MFLAISNSDGKTILGFYSLCPASLEYARVLGLPCQKLTAPTSFTSQPKAPAPSHAASQGLRLDEIA